MPRQQKQGNVVSKRRDLRDGLDATARRSARQSAARRLDSGGTPDEDSRASEAACGVDPRDDRQGAGAAFMPREERGDGTLAARNARPGAGRETARAESDPDGTGTRSRKSDKPAGPH
jgi:hypothetical protein